MSRTDPALLEPARFPFSCAITTRFADLDPNDHINNVAMSALLEDARVRFLGATGVRAAMPAVRYMVVQIAIDFVAQAHYPQPLECWSALAALGRTSYTVQQLLMQEGRVVAAARTVVVCTDGQRPVPITDDARKGLAPWMLR